MNANVPPWVAWVLILAGLLLAALLAYRDLHKEYETAGTKLVSQEWEYRRKNIIKQRESSKLKDIPSLLNEIRKQMEIIVSEASNDLICSSKDLMELHEMIIYAETESQKAVAQAFVKGNTIDKDLMFDLEMTNAMEASRFGLSRFKGNDPDWKRLTSLLADYKPSYLIDSQLNQHITNYLIMLNGISHYELRSLYIDTNDNEAISNLMGDTFVIHSKRKAVGGKTGRENRLDKEFVEINKRIEKLMAGDEEK